MTNEPVTYSPLFPYYILLFAIILVWSFAGVEVSSYLLVSLYTNPLLWLAYSFSIMLALTPILWVVSRIMKRRVSFNKDMDWEFHSQELRYDTYASMMADYASGYSHLISRQDKGLLAGALVTMSVAVLMPVVVAAISVNLVFILPFAYGGLELVYGILLSSYFYRRFSNDASTHFGYENPSRLKKAINLLEHTPGFGVIGVRFSMGEAGGYFAIRTPAAVGRIVGIEAVAFIEITVANITPPMTAFGTVSSTLQETSKRMMELQPGIEPIQLENMVQWCITTYIEENGSNEILDDLIDELGIDMPSGDESTPSID
ncbi:MAG: hypothetical protein ACXADF_02860 [Candidatus Thorarchaeota archaeon]